MTDDSRARILTASLELFAQRGAHAVSVREIADRVGLTKTAVLYHFPSKSEILAALVQPLLMESEAVLEAAAAIEDPRVRCWAVIEGLLDVWLSHRQLLRIHLRDQALSEDAETFARLRDLALAVQELITGPNPALADRVRAAQLYAALSDPVVWFAEEPADQLRAAILDGARRLLGTPPPSRGALPARPVSATATPSPTRRGRPGAMTEDMISSARRLRDSGDHSIDEIAARFGVSRATLYRHLATESH
ncbi:TetR family transcriptional regulator [Nocardia sp. CDC153]|uniref:TetR family transcriptional regulator n=1 Tax=Nocardia sp. CDC153 TaxID=3112167 RepID=UPI002DB6D8DE|nr:TetR family transcriptional regulator [Nocardia sp. CDC153]MEC3953618.1 TetR family transcriptional regulator [Nocardia sp. CDC153]